MTTIAKKYKNPQMQRAFDGVLAAARAHDKALFSEDGGMRSGSSQACAFWGGYLGKKLIPSSPDRLRQRHMPQDSSLRKSLHHDNYHH